jgi:two-component system chemotaxis response regulator CheB
LPPTFEPAIVTMLQATRSRFTFDTLRRHSPVPIREASTGDLVRASRVYAAANDRHLIVDADARLSVAESCWLEPSANWLFESAAVTFRERHVAVVLSGARPYGVAHLKTVRRHGGAVLVQATDDAEAEPPFAPFVTDSANAIVQLRDLAEAIDQILPSGRGAIERASNHQL